MNVHHYEIAETYPRSPAPWQAYCLGCDWRERHGTRHGADEAGQVHATANPCPVCNVLERDHTTAEMVTCLETLGIHI